MSLEQNNNPPTNSLPGELTGGPFGIRGFHYQHVYGMLLSVYGYLGNFQFERIIPEGSNDYEIQISDSVILIECKSFGDGKTAEKKGIDPKIIKKLWKRPIRKNFEVQEFQLVLNRVADRYQLSEDKTSIMQTNLNQHPLVAQNPANLEKTSLLVEKDPFHRACQILISRKQLLPVVANIVCSILTHKIVDLAIKNGPLDLEDRTGLCISDIERTINDILNVCDTDKVAKLIRQGVLRECDFTPALTSSEVYLNTDIRLGHVTSGQVLRRPKVVSSAKEKLETGGSCIVTGPSGSGKSGMLWEIVDSTREKVCWYEVTTKAKFNAEALTSFLRAVSYQQHIGFVIDDIRAGKQHILDQIIQSTKGNERVWILGSVRTEDLKFISLYKAESILNYRPDSDFAEQIFDQLVNKKLTEQLHWKEAWEKSSPHLLEYISYLTQGKPLFEVILNQVQARLIGSDSIHQNREDELEVLKIVLPVVTYGGRIDHAMLKRGFHQKVATLNDKSFSVSNRRPEQLIDPDNRLAFALLSLIGEFIQMDNDKNGEISGIQSSRSDATAEALIELGILTKKELASRAIQFSNINTLQHVAFRVIYEQILTESELIKAIEQRFTQDGDNFEEWVKLGNGVYQGRLSLIIDEWYHTKYLKSEFPPTLAVPVAFYTVPPAENGNTSKDDELSRLGIGSSMHSLHLALFNRIDSICLPNAILFNILNLLKLNSANISLDLIQEALQMFVEIKIPSSKICQLKTLRFDFESMSIIQIAKLFDAASEISDQLHEAWVQSYEASKPALTLVEKLVQESLFALPANISKVQEGFTVTGNFRDSLLIEDEIDHEEVRRSHCRRIKALVPNTKSVTSKIIGIEGNESSICEPIVLLSDSVTDSRQFASDKVGKAIEACIRRSDWSSFLTEEEQLLRELFALCILHLNRLCVGNLRFDDISDQFVKLTDRAGYLVSPLTAKIQSDSPFLKEASLNWISTLIGYPIVRRLWFLPYDAEEILGEINKALNSLSRICEQRWEFTSKNPKEILKNIREFLERLRMTVLESYRSNTNPFRTEKKIPLRQEDRAFTRISSESMKKFGSYLKDRETTVEESIKNLMENATVERSSTESTTEYFLRFVIKMPVTSKEEWTLWFLRAKSVVDKLSGIFDDKEDFCIVPVINDQYAVGYRWENRYEKMRYSQTQEQGLSLLELNRFLHPMDIMFKDVDFKPRVKNLSVYVDFINLCSVSGFIFEMHDGKRKLEAEFEFYDKAVILLRNSYLEFQSQIVGINNRALDQFCELVERLLEGHNLLETLRNSIDREKLMVGFAEVVWRSSIQGRNTATDFSNKR